MTDLIEIVFTTDTNGTQWTCSAWDPRTETNVMVYKGGGGAAPNTLTFIGDEYLLTANSSKPIIHIWPINNQDQVSGTRFIAPGKVSALAASPDAAYLVAGIQESIHIWNLSSGKMLNALSKHYQPVTVVKFTDDGSHFVTAGQDGNILVWNRTRALSMRQNDVQPLYAFNDHGLSVTDLHIGAGGMRAMLCSVSLDRTCKIYDLSAGGQLLNVVFPEALQCVTMNAAETVIYVGSTSGKIYDFSIVSPPRRREYHLTDDEGKLALAAHKDAVTCMALSIDGALMMSGGRDENIHIWHMPSRQRLRTIPQKGAVSNAVFRCTPHRLKQMTEKHRPSVVVASNLKRMIDTVEDEDYAVEVFVNETIAVPSAMQEQARTEELDDEGPVEVAEDVGSPRYNQLRKVNQQLFERLTRQILLNK